MDSYLNFLPLRILALALFLVLMVFAWQGNKGFLLTDEGFLWYGVQRVMLGEVPIRDFMAYDPGRYYWSAALMSVIGDNGIMSLRASVAAFQVLGLFAGLLLIAGTSKRYVKENYIFLLVSAGILLAWMFPRHKLFDITLSIFLISILTFLVQYPSVRRYFVSGICIGLVAVFGRNHGIYGVAGSIGVMAWLSIKRSESPGFIQGFILWAAGVTVGFTPILLMILVVPGFAVAFWESIRFLFEAKATNLPLPVPWPWRVSFASVPFGEAIRGILIGLFFIATVVFGVLGILWVIWQKFRNNKVSPILVGSSFLALPYAHFAYSRADIGHLSQGIFPLLIGCLSLLAKQTSKGKWFLTIILFSASLWVMHVFHPGWQYYISDRWVNTKISGSTLQVDPGTAADVELIRFLAEKYATEDQSFIATPFWPGAYAIFERKSPMWEVYALFPRSEAFEKAEVERIKMEKPGFVIILNTSLDGREELRFQNTHPLIYQYVQENFEPLLNSSNSTYLIYKTKGSM